MNEVPINILRGPSWPPYRALEAVERRIATDPLIDAQEKAELERTLEDIRQDLEAQASTADLFVRSQLKELGERVICLYGQIDTCWTKSEVRRLRNEAKHLNEEMRRPPGQRNMEQIAFEVNNLRRHINKLDGLNGGDYMLHYTDRPALNIAKLHINLGVGILQHKNVNVPEFQEIEERFYSAIDEDAILESTELFTIAEMFYRRKPDAVREFNQKVIGSKRESFFSFLRKQKASTDLYDIRNAEVIAQALVAIAYSDDGEYALSPEQLAVMFAEADRVRGEQEAHQAQISLIKG